MHSTEKGNVVIGNEKRDKKCVNFKRPVYSYSDVVFFLLYRLNVNMKNTNCKKKKKKPA